MSHFREVVVCSNVAVAVPEAEDALELHPRRQPVAVPLRVLDADAADCPLHSLKAVDDLLARRQVLLLFDEADTSG